MTETPATTTVATPELDAAPAAPLARDASPRVTPAGPAASIPVSADTSGAPTPTETGRDGKQSAQKLKAL